jgi:hypothetical protein
MDDSNYEVIEDGDKFVKRAGKKSGKVSRMRNLAQYRDLSDTEFSQAMEKREESQGKSEQLETRIAKKLAEYENDYDLSDLKINDRDTMRALIQAQITLEDWEQEAYQLRSQGMTLEVIAAVQQLQKAMSEIRSDISKFQADLNITRKVRKSDKDITALAYIDSLKEKAHKFYESKMSYVFCPKCDMLLGTFWTMFPEEDRNKIALVCGRHMPDGSTCGEKVIIGTKELLKARGTNKREITPESFL